MIIIKISKKSDSEKSFLVFKKAVSFNLRKYRKGFYFQGKKKK